MMMSLPPEITAFNLNIYGGSGGEGGEGGESGGTGGTGEGPTVNLIHSGAGLEETLSKWIGGPPDTQDRQYQLQELRHEATGSWLLQNDQVLSWKKTAGSLWIKGVSGTGKSVLSSTIIEDLVNTTNTVAYFFFDFRNDRKSLDIMLRSIVWQLSAKSPTPHRFLSELHKTLGNGTVQPKLQHLQEILDSLISGQQQTYIVLDGLDECWKQDWPNLVAFINRLSSTHTKRLHLLVTSQPLQGFQAGFTNIPAIHLNSSIVDHDIKSFVGSKMLTMASEAEHANVITEQIVRQSNGMFRLAACLVVELSHCPWEDEWDDVLAILPADLFGIYSHFINRARSEPKLPAVFIQAILQWLIFSARELSTNELADAIAFRLDLPTFDLLDPATSIYHPHRRMGNSKLFELLDGLVIFNDHGKNEPTITFAHSSVRDYILSAQFHQQHGSVFNLAQNISQRFITQTCVRHLLLYSEKDHVITRETPKVHPLALYAAQYWYYHWKHCDNSDQDQLFPSIMELLEDTSSQYSAMGCLQASSKSQVMLDELVEPAICMCARIGFTRAVSALLIERAVAIDAVQKDGYTALHLASYKGHIEIVTRLIESGASVHSVEEDGLTALHLASRQGHLDIVKFLLKHNAFIDAVDPFNATALHLAFVHGHIDIARLLIEHGASIQAVEDFYGSTPLHLAVRNNQLDGVKLLIEHGVKIDAVENDGANALHLALQKRHINIATLLIEQGMPVDTIQNDGWTALHFASMRGYLDVTNLLLERGALVDAIEKDGYTALHIASYNGHIHVAKMLIQYGASLKVSQNDGLTALYLALCKSHLDVAKLLIEYGASVHAVGNQSLDALHLASSRGDLQVAKLLIGLGASLQTVDSNGGTALHLAAGNQEVEIVELLVQHKASIDAVDSNGLTPLYVATHYGHFDVVKVLLEYGASVDTIGTDSWNLLHLASSCGYLDIARLFIGHGVLKDAIEENGWTALHLASYNGHTDVAKLLIELGASIDATENDGGTPLHAASSSGHLDITELLIQRGAKINVAAKDGSTALHLASQYGQATIAKFLIDHGASVDAVEDTGASMLHVASGNGHLAIVQLLIEHGACINAIDNNGHTVLHIAMSKGYLKIAKLLMNYGASWELIDMQPWIVFLIAVKYGYVDVDLMEVESDDSESFTTAQESI